MPRHSTKTSFKKGHKSNFGRKFPQLKGKKNPAKRPEVREKIRQANLKRWANPNYKRIVSEAMKKPHFNSRGEKHPCWNGGSSFEPYSHKFTKELKLMIRKRDEFTCKQCGRTEKKLGYNLNIHHIDYNKKNSDPNNLISLCNSCHAQTNFSREDWTKYFKRCL